MAAATFGLGWGAWSVFRPRPTLTGAVALAEAGRLDEAADQVKWFLRENPQSNPAHLLIAQIYLRRAVRQATASVRPAPQAARAALAHLRRIGPDDRNLTALVKLNQGKAEYYLSRLDEAEALWIQALRLDPKIPEAGWSLLDLYYLQGRREAGRRLALRLFEIEPDPHDRVQLLLELVRQDAQPPAPASVVQWFEPVVRQNPHGLHGNLALGLALVRDGNADRGLKVLEAMVQHHPDDPDAWDAWLTGLDDASQVESQAISLLARAVERLPGALAASPRFAKFQGRVAQERGDGNEAVRAYRRAEAAAPQDHQLAYRLIRVLRQVGATDEAERREHEYHTRLVAGQEVRNLYTRANAVKTLGVHPHADLYQQLADLRERMGLPEEARAWHRLVLRDDPLNARSRVALQRLPDSSQPPGSPEARPNPSGQPHPEGAQGPIRNDGRAGLEQPDYTSDTTTLRA
jgi:tetratricopeptide (TPR) repeat protein